MQRRRNWPQCAKLFVTQFVAMDLDSDGHPDLAGTREFGAKWARCCVWLCDPSQHIFVKKFLAEQMDLLTNLTPLEGGLVCSSQLGAGKSFAGFAPIAGAEGSRSERQLILLL